MKWSDIKHHAYAYLYGIEDRMSEALKAKVRASLERQMEILMNMQRFSGTTTNQMEPGDHDGPTIDLDQADYWPTEKRILDNMDHWRTAVVRPDKRTFYSDCPC